MKPLQWHLHKYNYWKFHEIFSLPEVISITPCTLFHILCVSNHMPELGSSDELPLLSIKSKI